MVLFIVFNLEVLLFSRALLGLSFPTLFQIVFSFGGELRSSLSCGMLLLGERNEPLFWPLGWAVVSGLLALLLILGTYFL